MHTPVSDWYLWVFLLVSFIPSAVLGWQLLRHVRVTVSLTARLTNSSGWSVTESFRPLFTYTSVVLRFILTTACKGVQLHEQTELTSTADSGVRQTSPGGDVAVLGCPSGSWKDHKEPIFSVSYSSNTNIITVTTSLFPWSFPITLHEQYKVKAHARAVLSTPPPTRCQSWPISSDVSCGSCARIVSNAVASGKDSGSIEKHRYSSTAF